MDRATLLSLAQLTSDVAAHLQQIIALQRQYAVECERRPEFETWGSLEADRRWHEWAAESRQRLEAFGQRHYAMINFVGNGIERLMPVAETAECGFLDLSSLRSAIEGLSAWHPPMRPLCHVVTPGESELHRLRVRLLNWADRLSTDDGTDERHVTRPAKLPATKAVARKWAEQYVSRNGFPGVKALASLFRGETGRSCSASTMSAAVKDSAKLRLAKNGQSAARHSASVDAQPLSDSTLATARAADAPAADRLERADRNRDEILSDLIKSAPPSKRATLRQQLESLPPERVAEVAKAMVRDGG